MKEMIGRVVRVKTISGGVHEGVLIGKDHGGRLKVSGPKEMWGIPRDEVMTITPLQPDIEIRKSR